MATWCVKPEEQKPHLQTALLNLAKMVRNFCLLFRNIKGSLVKCDDPETQRWEKVRETFVLNGTPTIWPQNRCRSFMFLPSLISEICFSICKTVNVNILHIDDLISIFF